MSLTIEEAKNFITDAEKARESWLNIAERSWQELKKNQRNTKLWSATPNAYRRRNRYPAWYSIYKIRQPLLLSRIGIPIGKDTTQDGIDNVGATAALCLERLAVNLVKTFPFFDTLCSSRDDFLATSFGWARAYYKCDYIREKEKKRLAPVQKPNGDIVFEDPDGNEVADDNIQKDDEGFYLETDKVIDVENEQVFLEPVLYRDAYIDPDIRRYSRARRIAFAEHYTREEFKEIFGVKAYLDLPAPSDGENQLQPVRSRLIKVFELWDDYDKEVYWFAENGKDFIKPKAAYLPDDTYDEKLNGLYDLPEFFPAVSPLVSNQATDEFWPIPEYYQLQDIFEDIHTIFSRMVTLTRAIRTRLLYDKNVEGLQPALNEAWEGDAFGVPNLGQSLSGVGGTINKVVQYIPVEEPINGLAQLYTALEQRLNTAYKLTGTSDLLQGLITDPTQRTFGERQMTEKYALNQIAEPQRKMQEFVRDAYELITKMALRNFKPESLDMYIMPQTLPPEHQQNYSDALALLKENRKRFRIELETDSTIALNEEYDKAMRIELVNTMTAALEKTSSIAEGNPALVGVELHALKFLIQGFRQGKMFQAEVTQAIDNVIKSIQDTPPAPPPFDKDQAQVQLEAQRLSLEEQRLELDKWETQANAQLKEYEVLSRERLENSKILAEREVENVRTSIESFKATSEDARSLREDQLTLQKIMADLTAVREKLAVEKEALLISLKEVTDKTRLEEFRAMIDMRFESHDAMLREVELGIERQNAALNMKEKLATEARLQSEHQLNLLQQRLEMIGDAQERQAALQPKVEVVMPKPPLQKKKIKVSRDELGGATYEVEEVHGGG